MIATKAADSSQPESSTGSPGAILRRCREFHGITLEEASETTKIGISHLQALEDDRIHDFANKAYLKGFLRIYATYLGLNSDDVARMYEKLFGNNNEKPDPSRTTTAASHSRPRMFYLKKLAFPAFFLILIIITATFFKRTPAPLVRQPQPVVVVQPLPLIQSAAVQKVQSSVRVNKDVPITLPAPIKTEKPRAVQVKPETSVPPTPPEGNVNSFILKVRATRNGTLTVDVDGSGFEMYELANGDIIEWKAEKKVILELGNTDGVEVEVDGKPQKLSGVPGKMLYVELDAKGIKH